MDEVVVWLGFSSANSSDFLSTASVRRLIASRTPSLVSCFSGGHTVDVHVNQRGRRWSAIMVAGQTDRKHWTEGVKGGAHVGWKQQRACQGARLLAPV